MANQDAINTLYELAKSDGYTKSIEEFQVTMTNNPDAVSRMYEVAKQDGYTKSIDDFNVLVGSKKKDQSVSSGVQDTGGFTSGVDSSDTAGSYSDLQGTISRDIIEIEEDNYITPQNNYDVSMEFDDQLIASNIQKNITEQENNILVKSNYANMRGDSRRNFLIDRYVTDDDGNTNIPPGDLDNIPSLLQEGRTSNGIKFPNGEFALKGTEEYILAEAIIEDSETGDELSIDYDSPTLNDLNSVNTDFVDDSDIDRQLLNYGGGMTKSQLNQQGVDVQEYLKLNKINSQKETAGYRFFKYLSGNKIADAAKKEEKQLQKVTAFRVAKLKNISKDLNLVEKQIKNTTDPEEYKRLALKQAKIQQIFLSQVNNINDKELIKKVFPNYYEHYDLEGTSQLMKRKRKYEAARDSYGVAGGHFLGELGAASVEGFGGFAVNAFAFFPEILNEGLHLVGAENKGVLKGLSEMLSDTVTNYQRSEIGTTERPTYSSGKEVMYQGELYMVTDEGQVLDHKTNVVMKGIIPDEEINKIKKAAEGVTETATNTTAGTILPAGVKTLAHMFGLIRTAGKLSKRTGISPGWGMGITAYVTSVNDNVSAVKADLMEAGLNEDDAYDRAILYGNTIATLDGVMSGLMGSNAKLLENSKSIKKQLLDLVLNPANTIKGAKDFSKDEFKRKAKDLFKENLKEQVEEFGVYALEKGVNSLINLDLGESVRSTEFKLAEMLEVSVLTFGSTTTLGAPVLYKGNTRADFANFLSKDITASRKALLDLEKSGELTQEQAANAYAELYSMAAANNTVKGVVKVSENIEPMADLMYRRQSLIDKRKGMEGPLKLEVDKQIADVDNQIQTLFDKDVADVDAKIKEQNKKGSKDNAINALEKENEKRKKDGLDPIEINKKNIDKKINELKDANKESSTVSETEGDTTKVVSEMDEGVSSELSGTTNESSTESETIRDEAGETAKTKITSSTNKNLEFEVVDGKLMVKNKNTGKSRDASKKQQADYINQSEFGAQELEIEADQNISEQEYNNKIISESRSPIQLAKLIQSLENDLEADPDSETNWESKFRTYKINPKSYERFGDKKTRTKGMNSGWMQIQNKNPSLNESSGGQDLDLIAQELSTETGMDITPQMLVDYINSNPNNKAPSEIKNRSNPTKIDANKRFTELTGLKATKENVDKVAGKDPSANPNRDLELESSEKESSEQDAAKEKDRQLKQYEDFDPAKDVSSDADKDSDKDNEEKPNTYFQRAKDYLNKQADEAYTYMVDKYSGVRKIQKAIEKFTGRNQKDDSNFDKAEKVVYGKIRNKLEKFNKSMSNFLFKLNNKGISAKDFDNYLYAKHSLERNKILKERGADNVSGSGMTDARANQILNTIENKYGNKILDIETAADFIYKTSRETLDMQLEAGLISKQAYDDILKDEFKNYVPLTGFAENDSTIEKENKKGRPMSSGLQAGKGKTKMTGRKTEAQSPIASIMQRRTDAIMNIDKNNVLVKLFNMLKGNPDTNQYVFYNEGNKKKKFIKDPNTGNNIEVEMRPDEMRDDPGMVRVMVNGVENFIDFVGDPSIGTILKTGMGVDAEQVSSIVKTSKKLLNFMRKVYTTLSPEFVVSNYLRDIQTGVLNAIADKDIPLFSKNMAKTVTDLVMNSGKSFKTIRAVTLGKTQDADGNTLSDSELKKKGYDPEMIKYYDDFLAEGGQTGYGYTQSLDQIKKDVDAIENPTNFKKFSKSLNNIIDSFNNAAENSTRLSAYIMAKKDGMTNQEAAALAKDLTINFNQSGTQQGISALYLFFNASVQGTVRFAKAIGISNFQDTKIGEGNKILNALGIKDKKLNPAQKLATVLTSFSAMIAFANISFGDEDEDGVPYYDKVPESIKRRNIVIMRPGTDGEYIKIPLPYGYNIFHNIGTGAMDSAVGDKTAGEFATNLSVSALEAFSPVSLSDAKGVEGGIINSTPSALRPIAEVVFNQNYFGQQIANEGFPGTTTPDSQQGRYTTSSFKKISRFLAEVANEKTGGTVSSSGEVDINPDKIDYLMQQYLGALYTLPKLASDSFEEAISEKPYEFNINKFPIARRFYGQQNRFTDQQSFYDRAVFLKGVDDQFKSIIKGDEEFKFDKKTYGQARALLKLSNDIKKSLSKFRKVKKTLRDQEQTKKVFESIKKIEQAEDKLYDNFNKTFLKIFKRYSTPNDPVSADN
tara:strand:- start:11385 stop:17939 length:6555 start_codon:yes stop_codon:yes gene_type:complete